MAAPRARAFFSSLVIIAATLAFGTLLSLAALWVLRRAGLRLDATHVLLVTIALTQGVACWGAALPSLMYPTLREGAARIGLRRPSVDELRTAASACVWALLGAMLAAFVSAKLGLDPAENEVLQIGREDPRLLLLLMPVAIVLIGPGEELLFRGIVQTRLRAAFSAQQAVVISSLLFASVHVFAVVGSWPERLTAALVLVLPSLAFGFAYERRGNLWVPALAHGLYDFVLLGAAYAATQAGWR